MFVWFDPLHLFILKSVFSLSLTWTFEFLNFELIDAPTLNASIIELFLFGVIQWLCCRCLFSDIDSRRESPPHRASNVYARTIAA